MSLQQSVVSDKVLDASGALSVASDKFGILSVVPILAAVLLLLDLTSLMPSLWYLLFDDSGSA